MTYSCNLKVIITIANIIWLFLLNCSRRAHITEYYSSCRIFLLWSNGSIFIPRLRFLKNPFNSYGFSTLSTWNTFYIFNSLPNTTQTLMVPLGVSLTNLNVRTLATKITRPILICYIDFHMSGTTFIEN